MWQQESVLFTFIWKSAVPGLPLPTSCLIDLLFFILLLFIVYLLYSLSVTPNSLNSSLCLWSSLPFCALWSCCSRLRHYLQSWNITLFGSLVFGAELPWQGLSLLRLMINIHLFSNWRVSATVSISSEVNIADAARNVTWGATNLSQPRSVYACQKSVLYSSIQ